MSSIIALVFIGVAVLFIIGIKFLSSPKTARAGNLIAAAGMLIALLALHKTEGGSVWTQGWNFNYTLIVIGTLVVSLLLMRQFAVIVPGDPALRLWRRTLKKLETAGISQRADEGPRDFTKRIMRDHPACGDGMQRITDAYLKMRYLEGTNAVLERELKDAVTAFKPRR